MYSFITRLLFPGENIYAKHILSSIDLFCLKRSLPFAEGRGAGHLLSRPTYHFTSHLLRALVPPPTGSSRHKFELKLSCPLPEPESGRPTCFTDFIFHLSELSHLVTITRALVCGAVVGISSQKMEVMIHNVSSCQQSIR